MQDYINISFWFPAGRKKQHKAGHSVALKQIMVMISFDVQNRKVHTWHIAGINS